MIFSIEPKIISAHTIVLIAYLIMYYFTFFNVKRKWILILNSITQILFGIHYALLGALSGAVVSFISMIIFFIFSLKGKNKVLSSIFIPITAFFIYTIIGVYSVIKIREFYELLPIFCNYLSVYSFWRNREVEIKAFNIPISFLWIIYNIIYAAWMGLICQIILLIFDIIFIFKYFLIYKKKGENNGET